MGKFHILRKFCKKTCCFQEKFTQLEIFLHDRRSWRSWKISSLVIIDHSHFHGLLCLTGSPPLRLCPIAKQHCLWSSMARVHWDTTCIQPKPLTVETITCTPSQDLSLVSVPSWLPLLGMSQLSQRVEQSTRFRPLHSWPGLAVGPWANAWSSRKDSANPRCRH